MENFAIWITNEWNRSGSPGWLKALMLIGAVAGLTFMIYKAFKLVLKGE